MIGRIKIHSFLILMTVVGLAWVFSPLALCALPEAKKEAEITLSGLKIDPLNISGIAAKGDLLVLGSDEKSSIQVFKKSGLNTYQATSSGPIELDTPSPEIDIEGIAWNDRYVYAVCSHSLARKEIKNDKTVAENHKRLQVISEESAAQKRSQIFRLKLDAEGALVPHSLERITLHQILATHPIFERFQRIPSKENGIDIEAIAVDGNGLLIGFRGPSLRGPYIPVLALKFQEGLFQSDALRVEDRFLDLGGRGIRDMAAVPGGEFLVLGGPVGDEPIAYQLYYWDGQDALPGTDAPDAQSHVKPLCQISCPRVLADHTLPMPGESYTACNDSMAKPEGVEALEIKEGKIRFIIAYDGAPAGMPTLFSCALR